MSGIDKKKKNQIVLLFLVFVVIVIVMFVANYRSMLVQGLSGPKAGVKKLSTCGNQLTAISSDNDIYTWDWNDLDGWPKVGSVNAQKVVAMSSDRLAWVPPTKNNVLVISNLKGNKELRRLSLGAIRRCKWLEVSPNGKYAVTALVVDGGSNNRIRLAVTNSDLTSISQVVTKTIGDRFTLSDIGVSNDGALVVAAGGKDAGWVLVADVQNRQILWEQTVEDTDKLNNVIFSPDGQMVYASEPGRHVYVFETATGKLVKRLAMDKYNTPANNPQTISCVAASPDGRLLAAATEPASNVWIWDVKSGAKVTVITGERYTVSGVSFSPDSSLLATGILVRSTINIWKIPENP